MKLSFLLVLGISFLSTKVAGAAVAAAPVAGDVDPALLAELQRSMAAVADEAPAAVGGELRLEARADADGIHLAVVLARTDGSPEIREERIASPASAAAQARAMARAVVQVRAERTRAQAGPAPASKEIELAPPQPSPIELARTAARPGIVLGVGLDMLGFAGFTASLIVIWADADHADGALVAMGASGGAVALGSLVSTASYTARHRAYLRAGLRPRPYKPVLGWVLTTATAALYGLSIWVMAEYFENARRLDGGQSLGEAIGDAVGEGILAGEAMLFVEGAIVAEAINLGVVRTLWRRDLRRAEKAAAPTLAVAPFLAPRGGRSDRPIAGLSAVVQF
jgi:hypothetical protein